MSTQQGSPSRLGLVFNIQRFSIHDGPGIRTVVFLKGCGLRCRWCSNPESWNAYEEIVTNDLRCTRCGRCQQVCPVNAITVDEKGRKLDRGLCNRCLQCADVCPTGALAATGKWMSVDEVMEEAAADDLFYQNSGGGITLSGGEPLLQFDFSYAVLQQCKENGVHTAIETAANFPWERVAAILPVVDLVMMDIKVMDSALHKECTGVPNERILANARLLAQQSQPLIVRTPIVPGVNDTPEQVAQIAAFVKQLPNLLYYELLPFHPMATSKYDSLDIDYRARDLKRPSKDQMDALTRVATDLGVNARHS